MTDQIPEPKEQEEHDPRLLYGRPVVVQAGRRIATPLTKMGWPAWLVYLLGVVGLVYVLNPGAGIFFEAIPDNLPIIGNMDEGLAYLFVWSALLELLEWRRIRREGKQED